MPLISGIVAPSTFRIPEGSQLLKETDIYYCSNCKDDADIPCKKCDAEYSRFPESRLVKELREVIDVTQDDYDNKCQEYCALEEDWANLTDFTSSLTGSPCDPEDIKEYINRINSMVTELKKENDNLKNNETIREELIVDMKAEITYLKKEEEEEENEEQLAAVECLQFMDYTYKDGRWFDEDEEEEVNCDCCGDDILCCEACYKQELIQED